MRPASRAGRLAARAGGRARPERGPGSGGPGSSAASPRGGPAGAGWELRSWRSAETPAEAEPLDLLAPGRAERPTDEDPRAPGGQPGAGAGPGDAAEFEHLPPWWRVAVGAEGPGGAAAAADRGPWGPEAGASGLAGLRRLPPKFLGGPRWWEGMPPLPGGSGPLALRSMSGPEGLGLVKAAAAGGGAAAGAGALAEDLEHVNPIVMKRSVTGKPLTRSPRRTMVVEFTCDKCEGRSRRAINPRAYSRGSIFVQCEHCLVHHKLVDNLKLFHELKGEVYGCENVQWGRVFNNREEGPGDDEYLA